MSVKAIISIFLNDFSGKCLNWSKIILFSMVYFSTGKHLVFVVTIFSIEGFSQEGINLFESKVLTVPSSFTIGVEGPAVDKNGNLYAVNFQRQELLV